MTAVAAAAAILPLQGHQIGTSTGRDGDHARFLLPAATLKFC